MQRWSCEVVRSSQGVRLYCRRRWGGYLRTSERYSDEGFRNLEVGQRVSYQVEPTDKGNKAINVVVE